MNHKNIYLGMTIVGTLAPAIAGAPYLLEHGYNPEHRHIQYAGFRHGWD